MQFHKSLPFFIIRFGMRYIIHDACLEEIKLLERLKHEEHSDKVRKE